MLNIRGEPFCLLASFMTLDEKEFAFLSVQLLRIQLTVKLV